MTRGKHLGHIVSKEGVKIDPETVEAINHISIPRNRKEVQYFLGVINFLRIFVPNVVEIVRHITNMLKKIHEVKWTPKAREYFQKIKEAMGKSLVLVILNYDKDFSMFSFASEHTIVVYLLHKNDENQEQPISFFNRALRDVELRYSKLEKKAYALVKSLKSLRDYILHSKTFSYVPNSAIKYVLTQPNSEGRRGKWIVKMQEYDLRIKSIKLIKGQGLVKLMSK
jgi:hypothetical protein